MRKPPAVSWPVRDDRRWRAAHGILAALAAASAGAWLARLADAGDPIATLWVLAATAAGAAAGWCAGRQGAGELEWTGSQWRWRDATGTATRIAAPEVMLDLQGWILLRWRPHGGGRAGWRSVGRRTPQPGGEAVHGATRWAAFRAAVYSNASRSDGRSSPESLSP